MELVWNNPSPNRTACRPETWEVIGRDGTIRFIFNHELQVITDRKWAQEEKAFTGCQTLAAPYLCF